MDDVKFKLNLSGLNELMKSPEMTSHLKSCGDAVARAAGDEYESDARVLTFTAVGTAFPSTKKAAYESYEQNTLLKALGSVGLKRSK